MKFSPQTLAGLVLIEPQVHADTRGYLMETFRQDALEQALGYAVNFCQDNESQSVKGVLRGLHFQLPPFAQSKLVRVIAGEVLDVSVDIRQNSPTFGQHVAVVLNDRNKHQLYIPRGFAHGFVVLSDKATFAYKVDNYYSAAHERGLAFDDASLAIDWSYPKSDLKVSAKDQNQPGLVDISAESARFNIDLDLYA
ncbi:dTDP-4-dehydrorhamnose 3,5-epimerase [Thiomicrospira microaerophila]|uniref:dTDP-4-dehydrorhamnose 3,5-epimerase n=1 Tax=Thiomicrospira microaerophila TaxID=406020 RepID=UPI0005CAA900|nr:dTDP-4-dehydrorhamnose 3,5-epimerase [Thiomicrospira microaerophila]